MKVDLALLHAGVNHLFPFLLPCCRNKMQLLCILGAYGIRMMLVKLNTLNDKESGNSKKDSVK